jgi:hypothetical protein
MSNMVRMKANDTLHLSAVRADNLAPGEEFEVSGVFADDLESRGLATRLGAKAGAKAEEAPANKAETAPVNKAAVPVADKVVARRSKTVRKS